MKIILEQMKKIADREFWETNPVYCISKILKKWNDSDLAVANLRENLICLLEILTNNVKENNNFFILIVDLV